MYGTRQDQPIIKGIDGLADSNPVWVRRWFKDILFEIIKHSDRRFENIPIMLNEAFHELQEIFDDKLRAENELKFIHRLKKYVCEYKDHVRTGVIAKLLEKDRGDTIHWYETLEVGSNKNGRQKIVKGYSIVPNNLSAERYMSILISKLKDTLEIVGMGLSNLTNDVRIVNVMRSA